MKTPLPLAYRWFVAHRITKLTPWIFIDPLDKAHVSALRHQYKTEVSDSSQDLLPFARRQDNDTIAGFVVLNGAITEKVVTVHLTWSSHQQPPGFLAQSRSTTFHAWISDVLLPDAEEWMTEEDLEGILSSES